MGFNMMKKGKSANKSGDSVTRNARSLGLSFKAKRSRLGMSLIEVTVAMGLTALMCGGLYALGLNIRRVGEKYRLSTEAQSFAKERLEEIIAYGLDNIKLPSCTLLKTTTTKSSLGYTITRKPRIIWHAADQSVVDDPADAAYAEVHIEVTDTSPVAKVLQRE